MKKGQVTIFIVIGIVILAILGIIYFTKGVIIKTGMQREAEGFTVPKQIEPIKVYIDDCVSSVAKEGVELIGVQGGLINIERSNIPVDPVLPFTDYLDIFGDGNLKVNYWFYETANGVQKEQIPSLDDIEKELSAYINLNVINCFNNFSEFKEFYITNKNIVDSEVEIMNEKVLVKVDNPIKIIKEDFSFDLDKHFAVLDVNLGKLYNLATQIINKENNELYLEEKTGDMIAVYEEIPSDDVDFDCKLRSWNRIKVYNDFREIVRENIGAIKIKGTNFVSDEGYFIWDALDRTYDDTVINFVYSDSWPFKMDVEPGEGNILTGYKVDDAGMSSAMNLICLNSYHFVYDVKYPVLISLNDPQAFSNFGYTFQFATQVILDNNQPRKNLVGGEVREISSEICNKKINDATIYAFDEAGNDLDDVDISYKCINAECDIGKTSLDENREYSLSAKLPVCLNGFLIGEKEGYHQAKQEFSSVSLGDTLFSTLNLKKYYNKNLVIKVDDEYLKADEEIILNFDNKDDEYQTSIVYPEIGNVDLISGDYIVKAYLIKKGDFIIKGKNVQECVKVPMGSIFGLIGLKEKECYNVNIEDLNLKDVVISGNELKLYAPLSDLENENQLVIYIGSGKIPNDYDSLKKSYELRGDGYYEFI